LRQASGKGIFKNLEDMIEFARDGIVSKTVAEVEGNEISLFCMATGQQLSTHSASFPAIIHVLKGKGETTLGKGAYQANLTLGLVCPKLATCSKSNREFGFSSYTVQAATVTGEIASILFFWFSCLWRC